MENEEKVKTEKSSESEIYDVITDWFLQQLVDFINGSEGELTITLNTGGILISGILVSGHKYFESMADSFQGKIEISGNLKKYFLSLGNVYLEDKLLKSKPPVFIHLKEAQYYQPGANNNPIPSGGGTWWRGKISAVDGFFLGRLAVENQNR